MALSLSHVFHTVLFIQDGILIQSFNSRQLTWVLLIGVYLYNTLLCNTYVKSSPHLRYFDSTFTRICTFYIWEVSTFYYKISGPVQ